MHLLVRMMCRPSPSTSLLRAAAKGDSQMAGILWAVVVALLILWLLGLVVVHVAGFFIHILLILAVIAVLYAVFARSRV